VLTIPFLRISRRPCGPSDSRLGRIGKVLDLLHVGFPQGDPESSLSAIPSTAAPRKSGPKRLQPFEFPLKFSGRIAMLDGGFELTARKGAPQVRECMTSDLPALLKFAPEALVAPLDAALWLADRKLRGLGDLPSLQFALVVTTRIDDTPLAEHHRELLWAAFQVPIFEQLRAWDGTVIARECEVHDGIHVVAEEAVLQIHDEELLVTLLAASSTPTVRVRTGWNAELEQSHCECGQETPRIRNVAPVRMRAMAAAAGR
jgi:hypothetical protein